MGFTQKLSAGTTIGTAVEADEIIVPSGSKLITEESNVRTVSLVTQKEADNHGQCLLELVGKPGLLNVEQLKYVYMDLGNFVKT